MRIFENLNVSKIFGKVLHPYAKFFGKHYGVIAESVRATVLELRLNFLQKRRPEAPKLVLTRF